MFYFIIITVFIILIAIIVYLNNTIKELEKEKNEYDEENIKLKNTVSSLKTTISSKEQSISKLNSIVENKEEQIYTLNKKITKLNEELSVYTQIKNDSLNLNTDNDNTIKTNNENKAIIDSKSELNEEKQEIYNLMENTNNNLFITGKAGTGKSYLLKYFRAKTKKRVLYCAPTGIAALNIDGVTLHSSFGWDNLRDDNEIKLSLNRKELLKNIDTLIIDEISMVRVDVFNQVDKILKMANDNNMPFGGKQIILFGDLFQLPPIAKKEETEYFTDKYGGKFFFNAPAYKSGNFLFRELEKIFRQNNEDFINILNNIRVGKINDKQIESLNEHYVLNLPRRVIQIVSKKDEVNKINKENLDKLHGLEYEYSANILIGDNNIKETDFPCDSNLKLKVGALVMMITNDQEHKRWVNGTLGIVSELSDSMIKVTINGTNFEISPVPFNKYKCEYDRVKRKLEYIVESSISQFPLILAYATTIHKSQGMTYQQIACNLDNCFAPGQAYVALSRCADYDKLYLTKKINASSIITDNVVANFYNEVKFKN